MDIVFDVKALVIAFLILVPLERLLGLHAEQKVFRRAFTGDVVYAPFAGRLSFLNALFQAMHLPGNDVPDRYGVDPEQGHSVQQMFQRYVATVKLR